MKSSIWLIGASKISEDYSNVLKALKTPFEVIGRGKSSALRFKKNTGISVKSGGIKKYLKNNYPDVAIVAVGIQDLFLTTKDLINSETKKILLEKPGSLTIEEIKQLNILANKKKTKVLIAYNRRFYSSIAKVKTLIKKDGGLTSMKFEFTEWIDRIKPLSRNPKITKKWLLANSHVIDLAFHLGGKPKNWKSWQNGSFNWHPSAASFCGAGITKKKILFSYLSDWKSAGSWCLELMTNKNRYILKPLEKLKLIKIGKMQMHDIKFNDLLDKKFKPGIFTQTKKFIENDNDLFCSLSEQIENMKIFYKIAGYLS